MHAHPEHPHETLRHAIQAIITRCRHNPRDPHDHTNSRRGTEPIKSRRGNPAEPIKNPGRNPGEPVKNPGRNPGEPIIDRAGNPAEQAGAVAGPYESFSGTMTT